MTKIEIHIGRDPSFFFFSKKMLGVGVYVLF